MKKILVVDVGGTNVKLMMSREDRRKFPSGPKISPESMMAQIKEVAASWDYEAIALGFPSPVANGRALRDPNNLSKGWTDCDFEKSLGRPTRMINDAALQALGSYHGGRMLFLGLGTGLGSTLVWENNVLPLELGDLPYDGEIMEDVLGKRGLDRLGRKMWEREVRTAAKQFKLAFIADYIVLGGGNSKVLDRLPEGVELGNNRNVYLGGCRLWETDSKTRRPKWHVIT